MTHCHNNFLIGLFVPDADAISGLREAAADGHLQDADHHDEGGRLLQVLPSLRVPLVLLSLMRSVSAGLLMTLALESMKCFTIDLADSENVPHHSNYVKGDKLVFNFLKDFKKYQGNVRK